MTILVIARWTVHEAFGRRWIQAGAVLGLAFALLFTLGFSFLHARALQESAARPGSERLLMLFAGGNAYAVLGLYAVHFLSSFMALVLASGTIAAEVESGLALAILARPVRRSQLVLGRWLACSALACAYVGAMASLLLLAGRVVGGFAAPDPLRAVGLMMLGAVVLVTVGVCGSTFLPALANGAVGLSLFALAWLGGMIELTGATLDDPAMVQLGVAVSLAVPSDAIWRGASYYLQPPAILAAAAAGRPIPFASTAPPATPFLLWVLAHTATGLLAAVLLFRRRDL